MDIMGPKSIEMEEGKSFLWRELRSLSCPFYSNFIYWLCSQVSMKGSNDQ